MKRLAGLLLILFLAAARGVAAEPPGKGGGGNAPVRMDELEVGEDVPLRMEELEVHGLRERPEVLYIPVHRGVALPSPVRYDLFLEDMVRPVLPGPDGTLRGQ